MENDKQIIEVPETSSELSTADIKLQVNKIQTLMKGVLKKDEHFGIIPGTGTKPSLLKSGAEKIGLMFRLKPKYIIAETDLGGDHKGFKVTCSLIHVPSGMNEGEGVGYCSTKESKYRYRNANKKCPACGQEAIIKGKEEYGGGWLCFKAKGGCGAKFNEDDTKITKQVSGKIDNENPADFWNTCLKMGKKRAHIDAILTATAASDIFTQDIEDLVDNGVIKPSEVKASEEVDVKTKRDKPDVKVAEKPKEGSRYQVELYALLRTRMDNMKPTKEEMANYLGENGIEYPQSMSEEDAKGILELLKKQSGGEREY